MSSTIPSKPVDSGPAPAWPNYPLYIGVKDALHRLPESFRSPLHIHGVLATDLFAFNSSLSATIEEQVVDALNGLRGVWDPQGMYDLYAFERRPQTFPDVVLRTRVPGKVPPILLGLELKGWYVLAKEGEPSFRYKVTPAVCAPADLIVIVPWTLSEVISGTPIVHDPYITHARFAAEYRNWWWTWGRKWKAAPGASVQDSAIAAGLRITRRAPVSTSAQRAGTLHVRLRRVPPRLGQASSAVPPRPAVRRSAVGAGADPADAARGNLPTDTLSGDTGTERGPAVVARAPG